MFQNKGSTPNAPWPWPGWLGCGFYHTKRPLDRTGPRSRPWNLPQPLAAQAGSPHAWPAPRPTQPRSPGPAIEARPTFLHARQLGLIHTHVGHGACSASGGRTEETSAHARPPRGPAAATRAPGPARRPNSPRAGNAPESSTEGERRQKGGGSGGGGGGREQQGCTARTGVRARQPPPPRFCGCRAQTRPQICVLEEGTDGCTCQPDLIGPV